MLGLGRRFTHLPFFWSEQYGVAIRYVGHALRWDEIRIDGDVQSGAFTARYFEAGELRASASIGRDRENLEDELLLESVSQCSEDRSEEHTSELQSLLRTSYAVFCLKK